MERRADLLAVSLHSFERFTVMQTSPTQVRFPSIAAALVLVAVLLFPWPTAVSASSIASASSLPTDAWAIVANGYSGLLTISAVSSSGSVQGSAFGKPLKGWWDGFSQRITFELGAAPSSAVQFYTGYLTV